MVDSTKLGNKEKQILEDLSNELELLVFQREKVSLKEKAFYDKAVDNFVSRIKILNEKISGLLSGELLKTLEKLKGNKKEEKPSKHVFLESRKRISTEFGSLKISAEEKTKFLSDLKLTKDELKKLRKTLELAVNARKKLPLSAYFRKPNSFVSLSSKIFFNISLSLSSNEIFRGLHTSIRKAAMPFLLHSYISLMLFSTSLALIGSIVGAIVVAFISGSQNLILDIARNIVISFTVPIFTFFMFYLYPYSQISTFKTKIETELPFVIMHMSTIAGSGVEPTRIFKIIALSKDYPAVGKEARKMMNQINFYGYDLVNSLRATAKTASSVKLADLLNGMATIISTGGNLQSYLKQSSENALLDYRLKRQKYIEASATYADVYTGLLITAPLLFMLLLSLIKVIGLGMDVLTLGIIGIGSIIVLNIGFLIFLHISQPEG